MNTLDFRKRAIMSTLGNVEKTVKVEGDKTIKFSNDTDYKITNFKLYGWTNEIGEGEKSPDNPYTFEHYENPSITVRGKNILDTKSLKYSSGNNNTKTTVLENGYIKIKPTSENPTNVHYSNFNFSFEPGTYTIFVDIISTNYTHTDNYIIYSTTTGWISKKVPTNLTVTENKTINFGIYMDRLQNGQLTTEDEMVVSVMILKGSLTSSEIGEYEPYKEPKTIQLSDVVLRGLLSNKKADTLYTNSIDWKGYAIDDKAYWSDSLQYDNGRVYLAEDVQECIATDYAHNGDSLYENENNDNICQSVVFKAKVLGQPNEDYVVNTWFGAKTCFVPSDYTVGEVAIESQRSTHFKTTINGFWTMARYDKYKNHFGTGGVSGSWRGLYAHSVSKSVATTRDEIAIYMRNLWNTQEVHYIMPRDTTEKDIGDTNATALKQLLSQSFSGTTIIETNGYIKAEFKYKE